MLKVSKEAGERYARKVSMNYTKMYVGKVAKK